MNCLVIMCYWDTKNSLSSKKKNGKENQNLCKLEGLKQYFNLILCLAQLNVNVCVCVFFFKFIIINNVDMYHTNLFRLHNHNMY